MEFHKILVPISGTEADKETLMLACQLAKKTKAKIWAVYVIAVKRSLPLNADIEGEIRMAEGILDNVQGIVEEQDYEVETDLLQAREVGPTIVDEAADKEADLILMGVKYQWRFGQFNLGSTVPYVLKNAPCRVILYHQPTEPAVNI